MWANEERAAPGPPSLQTDAGAITKPLGPCAGRRSSWPGPSLDGAGVSVSAAVCEGLAGPVGRHHG